MKFQRFNDTPINPFVNLLVLLCVILISACSSQKVSTQQTFQGDPARLKIVNTTSNIIDTIVYRPCGQSQSGYETLTQIVKPKEKVSVVIYSSCVDLIAYDAFQQPLSQKPALKLADHSVWTIE